MEDARRCQDFDQAGQEQGGHAGADRERLHPAVGQKRELLVLVDALQVFGDRLQFLEDLLHACVDAVETTVDAVETTVDAVQATVDALKALVVEEATRGVLRARRQRDTQCAELGRCAQSTGARRAPLGRERSWNRTLGAVQWTGVRRAPVRAGLGQMCAELRRERSWHRALGAVQWTGVRRAGPNVHRVEKCEQSRERSWNRTLGAVQCATGPVCATRPTRLCLLIVRAGVLGSAQTRVDYIALELGRVNLWVGGKVVRSCGIPVVLAHGHEGRGAGEARAL